MGKAGKVALIKNFFSFPDFLELIKSKIVSNEVKTEYELT